MTIYGKAAVKIRWPMGRNLPKAGSYQVYRDDGAGGALDYTDADNPTPIPAWPPEMAPTGFGAGGLGTGQRFGYGSGGAGFGQGMFGQGPFGRGARTIEHQTEELADGSYNFEVVSSDEVGNETQPGKSLSCDVIGDPGPSASLRCGDYDAASDTLSFSWALSDDDV